MKHIVLEDASPHAFYRICGYLILQYHSYHRISRHDFAYFPRNPAVALCPAEIPGKPRSVEAVYPLNTVLQTQPADSRRENRKIPAFGMPAYENGAVVERSHFPKIRQCRFLRGNRGHIRHIQIDLAFEKSEVEAEITTPVLSIKNPASGHIYVPAAGELIFDDEQAKGQVMIQEKEAPKRCACA